MRVKSQDITALIETISPLLTEGEGKLFLYGSRTDDSLKGGDIDLLLILKSEDRIKTLSQKKSFLLNEFKKKIGDRRIDFSILSESGAAADPFYSEVLKTAVLLKAF